MSITITDNGNTVKWSDSEKDKDVLFNKKELLTAYHLRAGKNEFEMRASNYSEAFLYESVTSPSSTDPDDLLDKISAFTTSQEFTNTVFVSTESDFPTAVGGVITLAEDTVYVLLDTITTANRLVLASIGGITTFGATVGNIIYTGTGTFLTCASDGFTMDKIVMFSTSGAATLFAITGAPSTFPAFFILETISFVGFNNLGTINGVSLRMGNTGFVNFDQGLSITGSLVCQITGGLFTNTVAASTPFLTLSGAHDLIQIKDCNMDTLATEEVLFVDPAITLNSAVITGNVFLNSTSFWFAAGSLDETDIRFTYDDNGDAPVSQESAFIYISTPAAAETVVAGTFEKIAGTYTAKELNRFTHANGVLTYVGKTTKSFTIAFNVSITTSDNNRFVNLRVGHNGTALASSNQQRKISTGADLGSWGTGDQVTLETGDTIEPMYTTETLGTDITTLNLTFSIQ